MANDILVLADHLRGQLSDTTAELVGKAKELAGATGGQVFRLRGQGLPRLAGEGTGDLYVTIRVEMPTGLDARTQDLVRQLERLMPAEPRAALARFRGGGA